MTMPDYIKITHQPKTMATPTIRAALTSDDICPGPLSEDDLRRGWNQQADRYNQWESLDSAEQLAWAQALAIKADRHAAALKAEPRRQGPTDEDLYDLAAEFNGDPVPAMRRALELWGNPLQGAPAPGENPATPPAPEGGGGPTLADVDELCAEFGFRCDDSDSLEMLRDMIAAALARWVHTSAAAPEPGENLATPSAPPPQTPPIDEAWWHELINEIARVQYVAAGEGQGGRFDLAKAVELWCCRATSLAPVAELDDRQREAVHQAVAEALGSGAYDCTRVWSAWSYGTMGPDDFAPVAEDSDRVAEIADAAIEAIRAGDVEA